MTYDPCRYSAGSVPLAQIPHKTEEVRAIRDSYLRAYPALAEIDFSAIEERIMTNCESADYCRRKADQHWEMVRSLEEKAKHAG